MTSLSLHSSNRENSSRSTSGQCTMDLCRWAKRGVLTMEGMALLKTSSSIRDPSLAVARVSCSCSEIDTDSCARKHQIKLCQVYICLTSMCVMQSKAFWCRSVLGVMKANLHARREWPSSSSLEYSWPSVWRDPCGAVINTWWHCLSENSVQWSTSKVHYTMHSGPPTNKLRPPSTHFHRYHVQTSSKHWNHVSCVFVFHRCLQQWAPLGLSVSAYRKVTHTTVARRIVLVKQLPSSDYTPSPLAHTHMHVYIRTYIHIQVMNLYLSMSVSCETLTLQCVIFHEGTCMCTYICIQYSTCAQ